MNLPALDKELFLAINGFVGEIPIFDKLIKLVVNEYFIPVSLALIIFHLWLSSSKKEWRQKKALTFALLSVGIVTLIIMVLNQFIEGLRPFDELPTNLLFYKPTDPSFPSNAAAVGFALAASIFLVNRKWGFVATILAVFYGFSRLYAGVHFPSDVVVGSLVGVLSALFIYWSCPLINNATKFLERVQAKLKLDLDY
jgi:undecaprenyl-diphosphatase